MVDIIQNLAEISSTYDALFVDVWGVIHNGNAAHKPACEALMTFRLGGGKVILVTNSPKTPKAVEAQLSGFGVPSQVYDGIATAGRAMQETLFFQSKLSKAYFIGRQDDRVLLRDLPLNAEPFVNETSPNEADFVLIAGPDYGYRDTPQDYEVELRTCLNRNLPAYCANPDRFVDYGDKRVYCGGAIADFYEAMGGIVYNFGKPFAPIYQYAERLLEQETAQPVKKSNILFIGDGVETDLVGAAQEGYDCLFVSGGLAFEETETDRHSATPSPNPAKLSAYLSQFTVDPRFAIGTLR